VRLAFPTLIVSGRFGIPLPAVFCLTRRAIPLVFFSPETRKNFSFDNSTDIQGNNQ
jgi:hypothetical protein